MTTALTALRLMPDCECHPLWRVGVGNVDPEHLPLSTQLKIDLRTWADEYDATLCREDPAKSGFHSVEKEQDFDAQRFALWRSVIEDLGPTFRVTRSFQGSDLASPT